MIGPRPFPSHTTVRTGPYTAVREVEVETARYRAGRLSVPFHSCSSGFTAAPYPGASPLLSGASSAFAGIWCMAFPHSVVIALSLSFGPSSTGVWSKRVMRSGGLLRPLLTSRSVGF